jgi:hypothetical protein
MHDLVRAGFVGALVFLLVTGGAIIAVGPDGAATYFPIALGVGLGYALYVAKDDLRDRFA